MNTSRRTKCSRGKKVQSRSYPLSPRARPIKAGFKIIQSPKKKRTKKKVYSRKKYIIAIYNPNKTISYIKK
jgi:hypothetical protein